ncbi:glycoside hydrolase family 3 N-terminal domain-containing protein [Streptomyces sp. NPDC051976]|uniref:glycoside hydrolase family 3 protein n=1 Tax=Streptomyces sp. NPDC051976 TaxID=3154947 RepID=UPI0034346643
MSQELRRQALTVIQPGFEGTTPPGWLRRQLARGLGGVCLFARNTPDPGTTARLTAALRAENPRALIAADEEGGAVTRLESAHGSRWPGNGALGRAGDPELTRAVAAEMGAFAAAAGIGLVYAPTADVTSDPRNPVIGIRSFGVSAPDVAAHTAAFVAGMQSAGVAACAKHFPGHGDTTVDSHHDLPVLRVDAHTLRHRELLPFRAALEAGVRTVMAGHLLIPCLDPHRPASLSRPVLTGLLREQLGFQGAVVTDALEMDAVAGGEPLPALAVRALAAGADLLCLGARRTDEETVLAVRDALVTAVQVGELPASRLADAAARVLAVALPRPAAALAATPGAADGEAPYGAVLGALAARRALELTGEVPPSAAAPVVVTFDPPPSVAVGRRTPWGVAALVAARVPGTEQVTLTPDTCDDAGLAPALAHPGRPLVLVVRDAARHPWITAAVEKVLARRPDAGVVEMGLPGAVRPGAWHLATYGPSLASARAAVALLYGDGGSGSSGGNGSNGSADEGCGGTAGGSTPSELPPA